MATNMSEEEENSRGGKGRQFHTAAKKGTVGNGDVTIKTNKCK